MKSASQMSMLIRAKKKLMQEDPDVIDSGGSPKVDLQDLEIQRLQQATEDLHTNMPKEHMGKEKDVDPRMEDAEEEHEQPMHMDDKLTENSPNPEEIPEHIKKRKARLAMIMSR